MMQVTYETHEQAMACLNCGLAGETPEHAFPQDDGLWDQPCPECGEHMVWVTQIRERETSDG
jgi:predicted RNA-binding Zn-ribbon protein involved in translation (DUF1610 family)